MIERILNKLPYVKDLKHKNEILYETNHIWQKEARKLLDDNESLKAENKEIRSYVGYLVNEPHTVMMDNLGKHVAISPDKLEKYGHVRINIRPVPPLKTLLLYAKVDKSTE